MANTKKASSGVKTYEGCNFFRQRLILSTLSGIPIRITNIRSNDDEPGLREFEASFLRILDKLTNGTKIEVNESGTGIFYIPGLLLGDKIDHDCSCQRSIGYYLEGILPLAPFCKKPLNVVLRGVTNDKVDISVDTIKYVSLALLKRFGINEGLDLKIIKRGAKPDGGGEIKFTCPVRRKLLPMKFIDPGKLKRFRGTAYCMKVAPAFANRLVDSTRSILNRLLSDVYIYTDHAKGASSGNSPGFGISVMVESTTGVMLSADACSHAKDEGETITPEDLGKTCAMRLLEEIYKGGCVDSTHQSLALLYMALGQMDVSKLMIGPLTTYTIQFLRHLKDFFNVMFKIEAVRNESDDEKGGDEKYILTCVGVGFTNLNKTSL